MASFDLRPDWVCERLSPPTVRIDIAHVWILDPLARALEILQLARDGRYEIVAVHDGAVVANPSADAASAMRRS